MNSDEMNEKIEPIADVSKKSQLVAALYHNLPRSMIGLFTVITVLVWQLYGALDTKYLLLWYYTISAILLCRMGSLIWYYHTKTQSSLENYHYSLFILGSSLTAICLGVLGSFLMPGDISHQLFILILITGTIAGATQSLAASYVANISYIFLSLFPIIIWEFIQILEKKYIFVGIFITMSLYCLYSLIIVKHSYLMLTEKIELINKYKTLLGRVSKLKDNYRDQSIHDVLTGLYNRQFLNGYLDLEINRSKRKKLHLTVIMLDIDTFKKFNDNYGHDCGDEVLQSVASLLTNIIRKSDFACRYGGEEFVIIMPETVLETAIVIAELIREKIKMISIRRENELIPPITASLGVSSFPQHGVDMHKILKSADMALYRAKNEGRDRICVAK